MGTLVSTSLNWAFLLFSIALTSGCFITNCPPGGKRSGSLVPTDVRMCESCGPPGARGRCYGPQICCSPEFGCFMGTAETYACVLENRFTTPCKNPGAPCGGGGDAINGQCAADGLCCSSETCTLDDSCHDEGLSSLGASAELLGRGLGKQVFGHPELFHTNEIPRLSNAIFQKLSQHRHPARHPELGHRSEE